MNFEVAESLTFNPVTSPIFTEDLLYLTSSLKLGLPYLYGQGFNQPHQPSPLSSGHCTALFFSLLNTAHNSKRNHHL